MILGLLTALAVAFSGSAALRVSSAKSRIEDAAREYDRLMHDLEEGKGRMGRTIEHIGRDVIRSIKNLKIANRALRPLKRDLEIPRIENIAQFKSMVTKTMEQSAMTVTSTKEIILGGGVGLGVGSAAAVGSWAAVSALGTASTGAAITTLYGAAHTSATLAALGGGALTAGGAGMAGGMHALVGAVALPVAAIAGIVAHGKANEMNEKAAEIEEANRTNSVALAHLKQQTQVFDELEGKVDRAADRLQEAVREANRMLFRFGLFSKIYKYLRRLLRGHYYTQEEQSELNKLVNAIDQFLRSIGANKNRTDSARNSSGSGLLLLK
jgi:hypothetical protein